MGNGKIDGGFGVLAELHGDHRLGPCRMQPKELFLISFYRSVCSGYLAQARAPRAERQDSVRRALQGRRDEARNKKASVAPTATFAIQRAAAEKRCRGCEIELPLIRGCRRGYRTIADHGEKPWPI
jgi:hypothetical protein